LAIRVQANAKMPKAGQRRFTREEAIEIKKQLTELLKAGKVRESRSESAVGTLFVLKHDGSKRWCMDMRPINAITETDENKAPLQDTTRDRIQGAKVFTRLDMRDGYHHLRIRKGDEKYTAFITEYGLYEWTVACFGLKNAPAEFARFMSNTLRAFLNEFVVVYFDDIIIYSENLEEHWQHVEKVLEKLQEAKINLKISKCEFGVEETEFLGQIVNGSTTRMQQEKVKAILEWPTPKSQDEVATFRGLTGYYRQYIKKFSDKMRPMNELLARKEFAWTEKEEKAFQGVKDEYRGEKILILFDPEKQIWVHADASDYAIGSELSQLDENGKRRPILFYSRKLLPAEMNYTTADKELLAIVQTLKKYQHYLRGTKYPVIIKSDHRNLRTFMTTKELNARQARWAEELSSYNFIIEHIKGKENTVADALSRRPDHKEETQVNREMQMFRENEDGWTLNRELKINMITITENGDIVKRIREATDNDLRYPEAEKGADGLKRMNGLVIVPKELETEIIQRYHDDIREGHPGEARTVEKIQRNFYFPGTIRKVRKYIRNCDNCQKNKVIHEKPKGEMQKDKAPTRPWQHITMDFMSMPEARHPATHEKMDQILVVVDKFSKQTILIPSRRNLSTKEVYHILWERIFAIFGTPETITTDRDKIFRSEEWQQLMKEMGVTQILSTANHQQTDGQSERKIQEIQAFLRHYLDFEQMNWVELTPIAQYALNDSESATTKVTPNMAIFGTVRKNGLEQPTDSELPMRTKMRIIHESIRNEIEWTTNQYKRYYDRKRKPAEQLKAGTRVYLKRRTTGQKRFNITTGKRSAKLDHLQLGPFKVKRYLGKDNYELQLPTRMKIHPVFHISLLKPTKNTATQEQIAIEETEYEVERIIDKRTRNGHAEYLIKWKGYEDEDNTWEPTRNLYCPDKIKEYQEISGRDSRKRGTVRELD
jgi:RNase H-like domain found in reverse transcriptase/Reverse transcriptase (RNA-dependent DNA polymerase)/Integrase zinc binding domain/Chromo (CHRromatin Organisation MOdifier) domain/Integrase core domain